MDEPDILQHLLEIENQAATLVDDAQTEADRRVKEAEEQNRLAFDAAYRELTGTFEAEYQKTVDSVKSGYDAQLDEYRNSLDSMPRDAGAFSTLVFALLAEEA